MIIDTEIISCPILISYFEEHDNIKDKILKSIESQDFPPVEYSKSVITKSDWASGHDIKREYMNHLFPALGYHMEHVYSHYGYTKLNINNCWFQQYKKGSGHLWHIHTQCQWTNVYYVEMPDGAPYLELKDPLKNKTSKIEVREGNIVSFPSFVIHRSPPVDSDIRKTIISFNSCADIDYD